MKTVVKNIKETMENRFGKLIDAGDGRSLFHIPAINAFVYFRYSKIFKGARPSAFFGLRKKDIGLARGNNLYVCLVTDDPDEVFLFPFADFEMCYDYIDVGDDGQYKTMLFFKEKATDLYIPKSGRFAADSYRGLNGLMDKRDAPAPAALSHSAVQGLVGAIGTLKGHLIWFPRNDLEKIDRSFMDFSRLCKKLPAYGAAVDSAFEEIDVIWVSDNKPVALFEVEHSTPIYSGLLRMNDVLVSSAGAIDAKIVAEQSRRDAFQRQIRRPTFSAHNLEEKVSFISYDNVWHWHETLKGGQPMSRKTTS